MFKVSKFFNLKMKMKHKFPMLLCFWMTLFLGTISSSPQYLSIFNPRSDFDQQPPGTYMYDPELDLATIQLTGRQCYYDLDCPNHASCYRQKCVCQVGYMYLNATNQCWLKKCNPERSDCLNFYPNSDCIAPHYLLNSQEYSGHCVCLYSYAPNSYALSCQDLYQITPTYVWRKVLGYLTLFLVLPILGGILVVGILIWVLYYLVVGWNGSGKKKGDQEAQDSDSDDSDVEVENQTLPSHVPSISSRVSQYEYEPFNRGSGTIVETADKVQIGSQHSLTQPIQEKVLARPSTPRTGKYFRNSSGIRGASSPV